MKLGDEEQHVGDRLSPPARGRGLKQLVSWQSHIASCRPPRGGRGLKQGDALIGAVLLESPPARGAWIETTKTTSAT